MPARRTIRIAFCVTEVEAKALRALAESNAVTVSELLRAWLRYWTGKKRER